MPEYLWAALEAACDRIAERWIGHDTMAACYVAFDAPDATALALHPADRAACGLTAFNGYPLVVDRAVARGTVLVVDRP